MNSILLILLLSKAPTMADVCRHEAALRESNVDPACLTQAAALDASLMTAETGTKALLSELFECSVRAEDLDDMGKCATDFKARQRLPTAREARLNT